MRRTAPDTRLVLLPPGAGRARSGANRLLRRVRRPLTAILPLRAVRWTESAYAAASYRPHVSTLPRRLGADVVFCPLGNPSLYDPSVPLVSAIDSLAQRTYPDAFGEDERLAREVLLRHTLRRSVRLVCPSEFVRRTLLHTTGLAPERVVVIRPGIPARPTVGPERLHELLTRLAVRHDEFLLCPAAFVAYENHRMLLTALGMYRARHPASTLKLVCAGDSGRQAPALRKTVRGMGLAPWVILTTDVSESDLLLLFQSCRGVILPSLYDERGDSALTAMAYGAPVLCSGSGALREVVREAGVYFDPRLPESLLQAIACADAQPAVYQGLRPRGRTRAAELEHPVGEVQQYLTLLGEVA